MVSQELKFHVKIDPNLLGVNENMVSFDTMAEPGDRSKASYSSLASFYEDLILGAALPLTFGTRAVRGTATIMAIALFLHRELALAPATPGLVMLADLYNRHGQSVLAHAPKEVAKLFKRLDAMFPIGLTRDELGERVSTCVHWVRDYLLEDKLPHLGADPPSVQVLDIGSNGFVVGGCEKPSILSWTEAYRMGFLRGVLIGPDKNARRAYVASRKSGHVGLDLEKAADLLNEIERLGGELPEWKLTGNHYLVSGLEGSTILPSVVLDVLLRC